MTEAPHPITRQHVQALWSDALADRLPQREIHERARELIDEVDFETPIVSWGLQDVFQRTGPVIARDPEALLTAQATWHGHLAEYDVDPAGLMRAYFRRMLSSFADRCGPLAARTYGQKLVEDGHLEASDVVAALGSRR